MINTYGETMMVFTAMDWASISFNLKHALRCLKRGSILNKHDQQTFGQLMMVVFSAKAIAESRGIEYNPAAATAVFNKVQYGELVTEADITALEDVLKSVKSIFVGADKDLIDSASGDGEIYALIHSYNIKT